MPSSPAALRSAFNRNFRCICHKLLLFICLSGVVGHSGIFSTVSLPPICVSISCSLEESQSTFSALSSTFSGCGVNGLGLSLGPWGRTCKGLVPSTVEVGAVASVSACWCSKYSDHEVKVLSVWWMVSGQGCLKKAVRVSGIGSLHIFLSQ